MYHRIGVPPIDPWALAVSPANFESQLQSLRDVADVLPLASLHDHLRAGRRTRPAIAITFDDGYADNVTVAKPILERYEAPATVFLATGHIGRSEFWWDRLAALLLSRGPWPAEGVLETVGETLEWRDPDLSGSGPRGARARRRLHDRIWDWAYEKPDDSIAAILEQLDRFAPDPAIREDYGRPMNPADVRELVQGGLVDTGAHSVSHRRLTRLPTARRNEEIKLSRSACAELSGREPRAFSFPNGDLDAETVDLVKAAGFGIACTSQRELVWQDGDAHRTPRLSVPNIDGRLLLRWLHIEWLP